MPTKPITAVVQESEEITPFQKRVYLELLKVPAGETVSYGELARRIGCRSPQAVGQALKKNPFAPKVPCHRVVSSDGSLGGYHGHRDGPELERKRLLLQQERRMEIFELKKYSKSYLDDIDALMKELAPGACATEERLRKVIENPDMHQYAIIGSGKIVGCATLCICHTPEMVIGFVEAVVVTAAYRGRHLGRMLMERVLADAKLFGANTLHLTSNSKRLAANELYKSLGFELYDTNCYKIRL